MSFDVVLIFFFFFFFHSFSRVRLRLPWLWLVGVVSCTFDGVKRRLPPLTTQFLIRSSLLISQPSHRMYQPVMNYLFLKPAFDLNEVS